MGRRFEPYRMRHFIGASFKGRTLVFGTNDGGSIPSTPASLVFSGAMVELVYTADSKSAGHYVLVGSSPTGATIFLKEKK